MRIAINTTGAITGGAITHLRGLIPSLLEFSDPDDLIVLATRERRDLLELPRQIPWFELPPRPRIVLEVSAIPHAIRQVGADVVLHPANIALYRSPAPQVTLVHNLAPFLPEVVSKESCRQRLRLRILRRLTLDAVQRADRVVFLTHWSREVVLRGLPPDPKRFPVIYWGCDHVWTCPDTDVLDRIGLTSNPFILCVSHLYSYKRVEVLLDAVSQLPYEFREVPLVIAGAPFDRSYYDSLRRRARRHNIRASFTGMLEPADVFTLLRRCTVFVFPSEAESLAVTLLEALESGAPVITNRACCIPEVCGNGSLLVDEPDASGYAHAISTLLADSTAREELSRRGRQRAAAFRWRCAAQATLDVLREVARG